MTVTNVGLGFDAMVRRDKEACQRSYNALLKIRGEWAIVTIDRLLGMLSHAIGDVSKAVEHLEDSLAFYARTGHIPEYAWTCWSYASVLLERKGNGDRLRAQELLEEALQISTDLGMPPLRQRVDDLISRAGETPASGYPGGLSQREVDVLRLISNGKTDREIAEELIIAIRTVNTHVGNIPNKTGATNRAEAAVYASRHDLTLEAEEDSP